VEAPPCRFDGPAPPGRAGDPFAPRLHREPVQSAFLSLVLPSLTHTHTHTHTPVSGRLLQVLVQATAPLLGLSFSSTKQRG
jgi:hypothetical protein